MPIQFDNFDQQKLDRLKNHLVSMAAKRTAKFYEIFVDTLKAVPKTDEPNEFEGYEDYMTPDSEQIKIVIYNSGSSPRNDQYVFVLNAKNREEALLQGLSGMPNKSLSRTSMMDLKERFDKNAVNIMEIQKLRKEIEMLNDELDEKDEEIEQLNEVIEVAKANGNKIAGINISDIVSVALESMVRRNTHLLAQIPAAQGLAGLIDKDTQRMNNPTPQIETEATFKKKDPTQSPALSEQEKEFVNFFHNLQQHFSPEEFSQAMSILECLSRNKAHIQTVLDLISK